MYIYRNILYGEIKALRRDTNYFCLAGLHVVTSGFMEKTFVPNKISEITTQKTYLSAPLNAPAHISVTGSIPGKP